MGDLIDDDMLETFAVVAPLDGVAAALAAPRFAWRFWDATPVAHGTVGIGVWRLDEDPDRLRGVRTAAMGPRRTVYEP
jgi:hypothetical protein